MKTTSLRANALACALLAGTAYCGFAAAPAAAQVNSPTYRNLDSNGVDLVRGDFLTGFPEGSIGAGDSELALLRMLGATGGSGTEGSSQWDHIVLSIVSSGTWIDFGSRSDKFPGAETRGATLSGGAASYQYRSPDGTVIAFGDPTGNGNATNFCDGTAKPSCMLVPISIASPDGKVVNINYEFWTLCIETAANSGPPYYLPVEGEPSTIDCQYTPRIASVTNSYGYEIRFAYASPASGGATANPPASFHRRTGATFHNIALSSSALAGVSYSYPSAGVTDITDQGGRVWRVTSASTHYAVRRPGASADTISASLSGGIVTSVAKDGATTAYSRIVSGSTVTTTVTNALSQATTIVSSLTSGRPVSVTDPLSHMTGFQYDSDNRLKRVTAPEGNYVEHTYDARGNVTQTVAVPKGGSGPTIVTYASFDSTCVNPVKCNQPNSTTDARGNVTDYAYDPTHGGVLTVTAPAPTPGAVRPQTRYSYTLTDGEYRLTGISQCVAASACAGTADEVKTALAYDPNGNVTWTASGSGDGALVAATTMTYDPIGNLVTADGPLPGTADTGRIRYNAARQAIGTVSPDPDGNGPLKHRAVRNTYDSSTGLLSKVEQGNVNSQSDTDWAAFAPAQAIETSYDSNARPAVVKLVSGSTVHALSQTGYDALGRPECSAQRMNPAAFGSTLPAACTLGTQGTGANDHGPDRLTKAIYDSAGRVYQTGTADEANEATATFTANGQVETFTDGENNKTTYEYDGHDRLEKAIFPLPSPKGAGASNAADYEQYGYDPNGNLVSRRLRNGHSIAFTFDALDRPTQKSVPASPGGAAAYSVHYGYDLRGLMTYARFGSAAGSGISFTYDALGRRLSETNDLDGTARAFNSQYDVAGSRILLTGTNIGGYYQSYAYDAMGARTASGGSSNITARFGYDDLGRRRSLGQGTTSVTSATAYGYDAAGRLSGIAHDFTGTGPDLVLDFGYNPAGQIVSNTRSNDSYSWTGHGSGSIGYGSNGINQITAAGSAILSYDANGNLVSNGSTSFVYDNENRLVSASGAKNAALAYDPLGRLWQVSSAAGGTTRFFHDGDRLTAEYDGAGNYLRTYVHGPGADEPITIHGLGPGPRFVKADERGSVIAVADAAGNVTATNSYDEYGAPASTATGRFGYTGQAWLPELGLYYYKARLYDPKLGRFMQTDPIGYGDGMNMYAYVKGDPVNFVDPLGLDSWWGETVVTGTRPKLSNSAALLGSQRDGWGQARYFDGNGGGGGGGEVGPQEDKLCPPAVFTVTGIAPGQADGPQKTAISQVPGNMINPKGGSVAINPENFGVPDVKGGRREVFMNIRLYPDWDNAVGPSYVPAVPPGLLSRGPYGAHDVIPKGQRHPGNQIDLYRYADKGQAFRSTRLVPMRALVPNNREGITCPRQP